VRGDVRFEWDARPLGGAADNLNCFFGGDDRFGGFTLHLGGFGHLGTCTLTRGSSTEFLLERPLPAPFALGRSYHFLLEHADRHLRLEVDGHPVIDYLDAEDVGGDLGKRFGFDCTDGHRVWIGGVKISHRRHAQRVSPLEIGDRLLQIGDHADAALEFADIRDAYPGSDVALKAEFRLALCDAADGRLLDAANSLLAFAARNPRHELAVPALVRASRLAAAAHESAPRDQAWNALRAYRGHPLLGGVLDDIERDRAALLAKLPRAGLVEAVAAGQREILRWSEDLGVDLVTDDRYLVQSTARLYEAGLYEELLDLPRPAERSVISALVELGQTEEAARRGADHGARVPALIDLGRLREVADDELVGIDDRMQALFYLGDFAGMRRLSPDHQLVADLAIYEGRSAEYLAAHPVDQFSTDYGETPRLAAMILAGEAEAAFAEYRNDHARSLCLAALGRFDEAVATAPQAVDAPLLAAVARAKEGGRPDMERFLAIARERAEADLAERGRCSPDAFFTAALLQAGVGDAAGARATLEAIATERHRRFNGQRHWHIAGYALGRIQDAEFLAQPIRLQIDTALLLAQGLRLDLAGDRAGAAERYCALLAEEFWRRTLTRGTFTALVWRVQSAGLTVPEGARVCSVPFCYR
jgi:hypothetical protein